MLIRSFLSEDAGSDVVNISTIARTDGDFYILNGTKAWVTSGYEAKAAVIFATVDKKLGHKGITGKIYSLSVSQATVITVQFEFDTSASKQLIRSRRK